MTDQPQVDPSSVDELLVPGGPGVALTFLYYFSGTALVVTVLAIKLLGMGLETGIPNQFGLLFGVIGGAVGTYFNRTMTLEVPFKSRTSFFRQLEDTLKAMGYMPDPEANRDLPENLRVYRRSALRRVLSGKVYLQILQNRAIISSRAIHIRRLKRKLI